MIRAAAYIRESTQRQMEQGFSPEAQRQALTEYAGRKGYTIVAEFQDSESGTKEARSGFQAMVEAAERGEFQAVLVFRSSRFARNVEVARRYKRRLRSKGVKVVSLDIEVDPESSSGFLLESVSEVLDEHYSRQLSEWTKSGFKEKHRQGGHVGFIPVGYDRQHDGTLVFNEDCSIIRTAFKHYATGHKSEADIARWLSDKGVRTRRREPLSVSGVREMLRNRTYLGYVKRHGDELRGKHKALIDEPTFQRVQQQLEWRRRGENRPKKYRDYALGSLLVCAACGARWRGRPDYDRLGNLVLRYYCYGPRDHGCTGKVRGVRAEKLEANVKALVIDRLVIAHQKDLLDIIKAEQPNRQRERQRLEARLRRVTQLFEEGDIEREHYVAKRDLLRAELNAAHPAEVPPQIEETFDAATRLYETWETLTPRAKRTALRFIVEEIKVDNGTATAAKYQPWVVPIATALFLVIGTEHVQALIDSGSAEHLPQV